VKSIRGESPDSWMLAGQLVSIVAGCLLVFPVYALGLKLFDNRTGLLSALFVTTLPTVLEVTADGISDGLFLLIATTALALGIWAFANRRIFCFFGVGLAAGCAYLIRPEGLLLVGATGITLLSIWIRSDWGTKRIVSAGLATLIGFFIFAGAYMIVIGHITNKPSGGKIVDEFSGRDTADRPTIKSEDISAGTSARLSKAGKLLFLETLRASNYGIGIMGICGFVAFRRQIASDFPKTLIGVQALLLFLVLFYLGYSAGYIARRHALLLAVIASTFAAAFVSILGDWLAIYLRWPRLSTGVWIAIITVLLVAAGYPAGFKRLHSNRIGHRSAGLWASEHIPTDAYMIDPFTYTGFFAGRYYRKFPSDDITVYKNEVIYVVIEPRHPDPKSTLPDLKQAKILAERGRAVFHWPPEEPLESAAVAVYECPRVAE